LFWQRKSPAERVRCSGGFLLQAQEIFHSIYCLECTLKLWPGRTFCPYGCLVPTDVMSPDVLSPQTLCLLDFLSVRMFCPAGLFVPPDVLSRRSFCPAGLFVPPDVLSRRSFCPSGRFVPVRYVPRRYATEV
jgi:hypothetical protein